MRPIRVTLLTALFLALTPMAFASTTWYVDGTTGSDNNDCKSLTTACKTIGHAISLAASGDSIRVAPATYSEHLTISISLNVIGSAASTTIVDGGGAGLVVYISNVSANVTLSQMTIRNGKYFLGGGIRNHGTLTINQCTLAQNTAIRGFVGGGGGGIYSDGQATLTINDSTLSGNSATSGGGGIYNSGTLTINNSTFNGNSTGNGNTSGVGGVIENFFGTLTINNSTLSGNSATGFGGGIYTYFGIVTLQNSIVANNAGGNCFGTMTSNGYNLSSDGTCNLIGTGDLNNTDPKLGPLGNYGGPTQTQALLSGSPAIDAGNPTGCTDGSGNLLKTDQRGKPRPDKEDTGGCDMGAYERQSD
jgi:hypothetical protein